MKKDTINLLRGLVYEYSLVKRTSYVGGATHSFNELNKADFEKLSGFVNWIESKDTNYGESESAPVKSKCRPQGVSMMWPDGRDNPNCICGEVPNINCEVHVRKFPAPIEADKEQPDIDSILRTYITTEGLNDEEIWELVVEEEQAIYSLLASEAVDVEIRIGVNLESGHFSKTTKVVPLSVIKELLGVAEK